eukprot:CAMPEP_0172661092 /NCGR_PEP_ID=MMETSP1074-20121228/4468_1 /TAXON_ID=2916 /ORGANISM="Ceratium fusus, Strain PA161109" /LENGTH=379 /DNA_ID=CAMNT_0013476809 /DNA_START=91 /DNA_END=1230 /DNA_ORIENTATION=+
MEAEYGKFFMYNFQCNYHRLATGRSRGFGFVNITDRMVMEAMQQQAELQLRKAAQEAAAASSVSEEAATLVQKTAAQRVPEECGPCSSASTDSPDSHSVEFSADTQATEPNKAPEASQPSKDSPARMQESGVHAGADSLQEASTSATLEEALSELYTTDHHQTENNDTDGNLTTSAILSKPVEEGGILAKGGVAGCIDPLERIEENIVVKLDRFFDDDRCWQLVASDVKRNQRVRLSSSFKMLESLGKDSCYFRVQVPRPYPGVQCRNSKKVDDRHPKYAVNGTVVLGTVEDDGEWLKLSAKTYLPMRVGAIQILVPEEKRHAAKEVEGKSAIPQDRWCCCQSQTTGSETYEAQVTSAPFDIDQGNPNRRRDGHGRVQQ